MERYGKKKKSKRNCISWYEILQPETEYLLEGHKYNSNSFDHRALAGSLQLLQNTAAVRVLIFVVAAMTGYSWDFSLPSDICQYYFRGVLIRFSCLFESLTVLLGQL